MRMLRPKSLFGKTLGTIAIVSVSFQLFTLTVIAFYMLVPLGQRATEDLAGFIIYVAQTWNGLSADERHEFRKSLVAKHQLVVASERPPLPDSTNILPYFYFLETALSEQLQQKIRLKSSRDASGAEWVWADIPVSGNSLRIGFPRERIVIHPPLALFFLFIVGTGLTILTAIILARRLSIPLERLSQAATQIGKGRWPKPIHADGPEELVVLVEVFNRMNHQVKELLTNRTVMLAGISHDLRTPLTQIQLALAMLPDEGGDAQLMKGIRRDLEAVDRLIGQALQISLELGEEDKTPTDIVQALDDIVQAARRSGREIRWQPHTACLCALSPLAFRRVITNLLDNAVRYGGEQPIDVDYECDQASLVIRISDRGPGIPAAQHQAVFRPFFRLEQSRSSKTGGSGLGLAVVRQLADGNGWSVEFQARKGGGTTAKVTIPHGH